MTLISRNYISVAAFIALGCHTILARDISDHIFDVPGIDPNATALYIEDIATGDILCDINGDVNLLPASTTKIITTAAATLTLSLDSRWTTTAEAVGQRADTLFVGSIVITPFGDPTLGSERFSNVDFCEEVANAITELGITHIEGDIVIDESMRIDNGAPSGWQSNDLTERYGAVYHTSNYGDNIFSFSYPSLATNPAVPDLNVTTASKSSRKITVAKSPESNNIHISAPRKRRNGWSGSFPNSSPALSLRAEIIKALERKRIFISQSDTSPVPGQNSELLTIHHSPTLGEVMRSLMVRSDNLLAESVLRLLAPGDDLAAALENEREILKRQRVTGDKEYPVNIADGSGLSRHNRINAYFMADVLLAMASSDVCVPFVSLFPRAGVEGTVKVFLADSPLQGKMALKSGSLNGVQCYSGYLLDREQLPSHIVVFMTNNFSGNRSRLRQTLGDILVSILPD